MMTSGGDDDDDDDDDSDGDNDDNNNHHHHCDNDDDDGHDDVVINVLHLPTADVAALDDDQDDESNDVTEYDVEIRAGLSTGTRHFSSYLLYLIKHTSQGVCFRCWSIGGEAFIRI